MREMKLKNTRVMTEGAIFAAIFAVIAFTTVILPILGSVLIWILPLPFIVYTARNGWKPGILLFIAATFVSFIIGGPLLIFSALFFGSGGLVVGELYKRKKSAFIILLGGSLAYITNLILYFVLSILILDLNPIKVTQDLMRESVGTAEAMLVAIGQDPTVQMAQLMDFVDRLVYLAPSLIISTGIFYALLIQLISIAVLKRIGQNINNFQPFREWSFPKAFLWYYLVTSILILIGLEEGTTLYIVAWNLFPILEIIMTIQGLAVVFYYCYVKEFNKSVPIIILIITFFAPFLLYIYRILGIIDLGFELRKRIKTRNE